MREGLGDWIGRRLRLGVDKQGKIARAELIACGIPIETLHIQWKLQQETQLSLRSRAYSTTLPCTYVTSFDLDRRPYPTEKGT